MFGSFQLVGVAGGFLVGSLTAALLTASLTPADRLAWGWRLPFLCGIAVGVVGMYMRWKISDTPKFTEIEEHGEVSSAPLADALLRHPKETLLAFASTLHNTVAYYIALIYMPSYMQTVGKLPQSTALWVATASLVVATSLGTLPPLTSRRASRVGTLWP